jgi:hypothetical protein
VNDEQGRRLGMHNCKLNASETSDKIRRDRTQATSNHSLELLCFITYGHADMHCLHSQYLVVTLFIVEHGAREVVEDILCRQRAIRLESSVGQGQARWDFHITNLYPFVPNEKSVGIVILRVQISQVHVSGLCSRSARQSRTFP